MGRRSYALASLCTIFFVMGSANAVLGPLLPELAGRNGLPLSQAGLIFSVMVLGLAAVDYIAGALSDRYGRGPVVLLGLLCQAIFIFAVTASRSLPALLTFGFFFGVGAGAVMLGINVLAGELYPERGVSALNLVNLFFGAGAVVGPLLASLSIRWWHTGSPALWLTGAISLSQVPVIFSLNRKLFSRLSVPVQVAGPGERREAVSPLALLRSPLLWVLGVIMIFEFSGEQTLNGWTAVYMHESAALEIADAALVVSGFWIAFTFGRFTVALFGAHWSSKGVLSGSLSLCCAGILLVNMSVGHAALSVAGFLLTGLGFGPVFPTLLAEISRIFGRRAGTAMGLAGVTSNLGGMFFVWLAGVLMGQAGPASGARLVAAMVAAVVVFVAAEQLLTRRKPGPATPAS